MAGFSPLRKDTKMQVTKLQAGYRSFAEHLKIAQLYFGFLRNGSDRYKVCRTERCP
jgi:hypothetical protein